MMRGSDERTGSLFSYVDLEARARPGHPPCVIRAVANAFPVTIGNRDDIRAAKDVMTEALRGTAGVLDDPPPEASVTGLGAAGVDMVARFWIDPPCRKDVVDATDHAIVAVKEAMGSAGIDLPYPTTQLLLHDRTEETDGDRSRRREGWPAGGDPPRSRSALQQKAAGAKGRDKPDAAEATS